MSRLGRNHEYFQQIRPLGTRCGVYLFRRSLDALNPQTQRVSDTKRELVTDEAMLEHARAMLIRTNWGSIKTVSDMRMYLTTLGVGIRINPPREEVSNFVHPTFSDDFIGSLAGPDITKSKPKVIRSAFVAMSNYISYNVVSDNFRQHGIDISHGRRGFKELLRSSLSVGGKTKEEVGILSGAYGNNKLRLNKIEVIYGYIQSLTFLISDSFLKNLHLKVGDNQDSLKAFDIKDYLSKANLEIEEAMSEVGGTEGYDSQSFDIKCKLAYCVEDAALGVLKRLSILQDLYVKNKQRARIVR